MSKSRLSKLKILTVASTTALVSAGLAAASPSVSFGTAVVPSDGDLVLFVAGDQRSDDFAEVDRRAGGRISAALTSTDFSGDFGKSITLHAVAPFDTVTVIGSGTDRLSKAQLIELGGRAAKAADGDPLHIWVNGLDTAESGSAALLATGLMLGSYSFDTYKSNADDDKPTSVRFLTTAPDAAIERWTTDLTYVVDGITLTRDLGTEPGNAVYPQVFVDRVRAAFRNIPDVRIEVLDARAMDRAGMGALLGVGKGSIHDPRLLVISYAGSAPGDAPIALVGKGITFDTGGISIKPNTGMWAMKSDLSGAAAVAGTVLAAAKRGEAVNLVGVMPLAENMPSGEAIRPGDVLNTISGQTIEIMSTDAEGRLILIDAVRYAQDRFSPKLLVNIATLTGSAARALGDDYAAVITRDMSLSLEMMEIGDRAGEPVWPLPLHPSHFDDIKSDIADVKNTAGDPGASIGAAVIGTWIDKDQPWVHLDIAGVDWRDAATPTVPKGHSGWGVRFMDELIRSHTEE